MLAFAILLLSDVYKRQRYYDSEAAKIKDPIAQQDYKDSVKYLGVYSYQNCLENMSITLTEKAAQRVRTFLENRGKGIGLRLGVKTSGCSGLGYVLEFVDVLNDDDILHI